MPQAITISGPPADAKLIFESLTGREELGRLFEFKLSLLSENKSVALADVLGKNLTVTIQFTDDRKRYFNGDIVRFRQLTKTVDKYYCYEAVIKPRLWFLTRTSDCKIFQTKSATEIIDAVLQDYGISDVRKSLSGTYKAREYCVQYNETDFDFISRLMEEEGIYYYFEHENGKHTLVLADSISAHKNIDGEATLPFMLRKAGYSKDSVYDWNVVQQVQSGIYAHTDYDFTKPRADLKSQSSISRTHAHAGKELFSFDPNRYSESADGETYAKMRIQEEQTTWEVIEGKTNCKTFSTGKLFKVKGYQRDDQNDKEHLLVASEYELKMETATAAATVAGQLDATMGIYFDCAFKAIDSQRPYRAASITPRPVVQGPQTAVVVGKSGEEIWTDEYGRVKVHFFWDRLGTKDENSSCWLRVAQVWAGKAWGGINVPRIGEEVIVEFLGGDPDEPIVTGRVYNQVQTVPYALPTNQTQSGLKTQSTKEGAAENFNELRFEDKKGEEQVYFHAEKNFDRVVENNDTLKVGFEKKDAGDQTIDIYNNRTTTLEKGTDKLQIKELHRETLIDKGNDTLTISEGNQTVTISKGNQTITISQGNQTITIEAGKGSIEAAQELLFKVGDSSIKITPSSIELTSVNIKNTADGNFEATGAQSKVTGSGSLDLNGGTISLN
jgi:type VI secretion system secreted protein VgrG